MFARQGDVDTCALTLTLEGGVLAVVTGARADGLGYDHRTEVYGSRDSVAAGFDERTPLRSTDPGGHQPTDPYLGFPERFAAAYRAEMVAFTELVAGTRAQPLPRPGRPGRPAGGRGRRPFAGDRPARQGRGRRLPRWRLSAPS